MIRVSDGSAAHVVPGVRVLLAGVPQSHHQPQVLPLCFHEILAGCPQQPCALSSKPVNTHILLLLLLHAGTPSGLGALQQALNNPPPAFPVLAYSPPMRFTQEYKFENDSEITSRQAASSCGQA